MAALRAEAPTRPSRGTILAVDDEEVILDVLSTLMARRGHRIVTARNAAEAERALAAEPIDVVLLDLFLPDTSGLELLRAMRAGHPLVEVIMVTAHGSVETAVEAMQGGAFHFLTKPFQNEEVVLLVETALTQRRLREENADLRRALADGRRVGKLVGRSAGMEAVYRMIEQVAAARTTVLIQGESGTGKELVAEAIHQHGVRGDAPFLVVNSSNLPADLIESHLFGHLRGAFTGATSGHRGLFEAADGGTLFFDEISTLPPEVQSKLLRVLQEKEFLPLGSVKPVKVDVRILAATNEDLEVLVRDGAFREDLFYRLNVVTIRLPALRDRREDVPLLVEHFLDEFGSEHRRPGLRLAPEALRALVRFDWPGNVRQLRNVVERAVLLAPADEIGVDSLPEDVLQSRIVAAGPTLPPGASFDDAVSEYERALIRWALEQSGGVQRRAAERLGLKPTTLNEKIKRLGVREP